MSDYLIGFPIITELMVRWGEMDAFNHLNNTIYFKYFEHVRIQYLEAVGLMQHLEETQQGPILAATSAKFKAPLKYPDVIAVATRISNMTTDRFTMEYRVVNKSTNLVAATGDGLIVMYDYVKQAKMNLPEKIVTAINTLEVSATN